MKKYDFYRNNFISSKSLAVIGMLFLIYKYFFKDYLGELLDHLFNGFSIIVLLLIGNIYITSKLRLKNNISTYSKIISLNRLYRYNEGYLPFNHKFSDIDEFLDEHVFVYKNKKLDEKRIQRNNVGRSLFNYVKVENRKVFYFKTKSKHSMYLKENAYFDPYEYERNIQDLFNSNQSSKIKHSLLYVVITNELPSKYRNLFQDKLSKENIEIYPLCIDLSENRIYLPKSLFNYHQLGLNTCGLLFSLIDDELEKMSHHPVHANQANLQLENGEFEVVHEDLFSYVYYKRNNKLICAYCERSMKHPDHLYLALPLNVEYVLPSVKFLDKKELNQIVNELKLQLLLKGYHLSTINQTLSIEQISYSFDY